MAAHPKNGYAPAVTGSAQSEILLVSTDAPAGTAQFLDKSVKRHPPHPNGHCVNRA
jgi:hypothetical protein